MTPACNHMCLQPVIIWNSGLQTRPTAARPRPRSTPTRQPAANFRCATECRIAIWTAGIGATGFGAPRFGAHCFGAPRHGAPHFGVSARHTPPLPRYRLRRRRCRGLLARHAAAAVWPRRWCQPSPAHRRAARAAPALAVAAVAAVPQARAAPRVRGRSAGPIDGAGNGQPGS